MKKSKNISKRIGNILFWSIISAAFIGPGTVTTASKAGAYFHYDLMWTMVFSIIACLALQETVARIAIYSGQSLAQSIAKFYENKGSKYFIISAIVGAVIIGGSAYETGNILGSIEGLRFILPAISKQIFVVVIFIFVFMAFRMKSVRTIAQILGVFVYLMGIAFILTAVSVKPEFMKVIRGMVIPTIPDVPGAGLLILGIIGTTVVPYDLFLGSGIIDKSQTVTDARIGLSISIILGGLITVAIMAVGSSLTEGWSADAVKSIDFNFDFIKQGLYINSYINDYALYIFGFGIFAAGITSAITAPLASTLTAKGLFGGKEKKWSNNGIFFNIITLGTLTIGSAFGFMQVKPVPVIIVAQALNGFILPFITIFVVIIINDPKIMNGKINSHFGNIIMSFVLWVTLTIGVFNIAKALENALKLNLETSKIFPYIAILNLIISIFVILKIYQFRRKKLAQIKNAEAPDA